MTIITPRRAKGKIYGILSDFLFFLVLQIVFANTCLEKFQPLQRFGGGFIFDTEFVSCPKSTTEHQCDNYLDNYHTNEKLPI